MEDVNKKPMRKIIHIDMDAFYASVEQRDNPDYRGKPVVVGGLPEGRGGVVATASYEARRFGIHSAMSSKMAIRLCPHAIFIRPRFEAYKSASKKIREIFHRYTDLVEPLSLDEAFLDVTTDKQGIGSALDIAALIKKAIKEELQLTASAGVSVNKFVAKMASEIKKPDGLHFIGPSAIGSFMEKLPVEKFFGVGKVTAARMKEKGLHTGKDLKNLSEAELVKSFGKLGHFYYQIVRGIDERPVEPNRETKSLSAEDTFPYDLTEIDDLKRELDKISVIVAERLHRYGLKGRTVSIKVKYSDFKIITRSQSFPQPLDDAGTIAATARQLLEGAASGGKPVRLLGINISNFGQAAPGKDKGKEQLFLFSPV
jgi:DNA polymerase-4